MGWHSEEGVWRQEQYWHAAHRGQEDAKCSWCTPQSVIIKNIPCSRCQQSCSCETVRGQSSFEDSMLRPQTKNMTLGPFRGHRRQTWHLDKDKQFIKDSLSRKKENSKYSICYFYQFHADVLRKCTGRKASYGRNALWVSSTLDEKMAE